ncbi:MAG: Zn-dependent hydrolase [Myxococcota bacterium]
MPLHKDTAPHIDFERLNSRLLEFGEIGRDDAGILTRLAASNSDKEARDKLVKWLEGAGLEVQIDRIGNIFGIWNIDSDTAPLMMGSHIDTVINAGIYDGPYGVLAALSVIEALKANQFVPDRPLIVGAFTNEEGARFSPDMMGSLVYAGGLSTEDALAAEDGDGVSLGEELARIGYDGKIEPGWITPSCFLELHIEQGPVLESEGVSIGAVADLQGISWQKISITGVANHAGTTPTHLRRDAGLVAAQIITFLRDLVQESAGVATVGQLNLWPDVINVVPGKAQLTVDLRDPDEMLLRERERSLAEFLLDLQEEHAVKIETEQLARFDPVVFDEQLVELIENSASVRDLSCRRMTSGAGHDAQMIARMCPSAMIFVPSRNGVSHNPLEFTEPSALAAGAQVLLDSVYRITER